MNFHTKNDFWGEETPVWTKDDLPPLKREKSKNDQSEGILT